MKDGRMVLCQLPLNHSSGRCVNLKYAVRSDYIELEEFCESEQRKATA